MAKHRKSYRFMHWLLFLYLLHLPLIPGLWADTEFTAPSPTSELEEDIDSGSATETQFAEIQEAAADLIDNDTQINYFFDTHFASLGDYGELKNGSLVTDWESMATLFGVSTTVFVAAYGLWRSRRRTELEGLESGGSDALETWLEDQLDTQQSNLQGKAVLKNGTVLETESDWDLFADSKGLAGLGGLLMSLYLLWKRKEEFGIDESLTPEEQTITDLFNTHLLTEEGDIRTQTEFINQLRNAVQAQDEIDMAAAAAQYRADNPIPQPPIEPNTQLHEWYKYLLQNLYNTTTDFWGPLKTQYIAVLNSAEPMETKLEKALTSLQKIGIAGTLAPQYFAGYHEWQKPKWARNYDRYQAQTYYFSERQKLLDLYRTHATAEQYTEWETKLNNWWPDVGAIQSDIDGYGDAVANYQTQVNVWNQGLSSAQNEAKQWNQGLYYDAIDYWNEEREGVQANQTFLQKLQEIASNLSTFFTQKQAKKQSTFDEALAETIDLLSEEELTSLRNGIVQTAPPESISDFIERVGTAAQRSTRIAELEDEIPELEAKIATYGTSFSAYKFDAVANYQPDINKLGNWKSELNQLKQQQAIYDQAEIERQKAEYFYYDQVDHETDLEILFPTYEIPENYHALIAQTEAQLQQAADQYYADIDSAQAFVTQYGTSYSWFYNQLPAHVRQYWSESMWVSYKYQAELSFQATSAQLLEAYVAHRDSLQAQITEYESDKAFHEAEKTKHDQYAFIGSIEYQNLRERVAMKKRVRQFLTQFQSAGTQSAYFSLMNTDLEIAQSHNDEISELEQMMTDEDPYAAEIAAIQAEMTQPNAYTRDEYFERLRQAQPDIATINMHDMWDRKQYIGWNDTLDHMEQQASSYAQSYANSTTFTEDDQRIETLRGMYEQAATYKLSLYTDWPEYYRIHPLVHEYQQAENADRLRKLFAAQTEWKASIQSRINTLQSNKAETVSTLSSAKTWLGQTCEEREESDQTDTILAEETQLLAQINAGEDINQAAVEATQLERELEAFKIAQDGAILSQAVFSQGRIVYNTAMAKDKLLSDYIAGADRFESRLRANSTPEGAAAIMERYDNQAQSYWGNITSQLWEQRMRELHGSLWDDPIYRSQYDTPSIGLNGLRDGMNIESIVELYVIRPIEPTGSEDQTTPEESAESDPANNPYWNPSETPEWTQSVDAETIRAAIDAYRESRRQASLRQTNEIYGTDQIIELAENEVIKDQLVNIQSDSSQYDEAYLRQLIEENIQAGRDPYSVLVADAGGFTGIALAHELREYGETNIEWVIGTTFNINPEHTFTVNGQTYGKTDWDNATAKMKNIRTKVVEFSEIFDVDPMSLALILHGENSAATYDGSSIRSSLQKLEDLITRIDDVTSGAVPIIENGSSGIVNLRESDRTYWHNQLNESELNKYNTLNTGYERDLFLATKILENNARNLNTGSSREIAMTAVMHNKGVFTDPFSQSKEQWESDPQNANTMNQPDGDYYSIRAKVERFEKILDNHTGGIIPMKFLPYELF